MLSRVINTSQTSKIQSEIAKSEKNDCTVRAIATACDVSYDKAHTYCKEKFGRKNHKGIALAHHLDLITSDDNKLLGKIITQWGDWCDVNMCKRPSTYYNNSGRSVKRRMTVGTFLKQQPEGTYIVTVRGHAFTIKDGDILGNTTDGVHLKRRLLRVWEVKNN